MIKYSEKAIEQAETRKVELSLIYGVPTSKIIWQGLNKFIVLKVGEEIRVEV